MLNFIYYPVSAILWFWHKVFGAVFGPSTGAAWALAVVFLVFTLRALLFKPMLHQMRSMRKMQEFAPQIKKLQEKYGSDRQKLAQEMQKLQAEHGVNPLGGCLPALVQIPVFIGLFHVLKEFRPGKTENYIFGAAEVDSFNQASIFGAKLNTWISMSTQELASFGVERSHVALVAIPLMVVASVATHFTARHSVARQTATASANPQTAIMNKVTMYLFPLGVLAGGPFFPIAILLYWLSNNMWTLGQQYVVYHRLDREEEAKKEAVTVQRQALAPKPGQKPVRPKATRSAGDAATPSEVVETTDSAALKPGEVPGMVSDSSRGRKQQHKPKQARKRR
ncbi:membrane protein insertase YidC [Streptoalloteichus hindustanus]|uniref:Membrane protein insertase YidC n=1 Tax=Streptoalloteichus hindustanus TaxID=2017 RepID=A0A1M4V3J3_STRHI|nr:membrane protein insertase YidC [Streptoalloteichus hindustanus]SHE63457.1 YidC/Oxa1 family membrane protein insertase [Streptoalloteichus hindustanus]